LASATLLLLGGFVVGAFSGLIAGGVGGHAVGRSRAAAEYEPRIATLEDEKAVLEARVAGLEVELAEAREASAAGLPGGLELPRALDDLRDLNILQRPYLGIQFEEYDPDRHAAEGVTEGVYVVAVEPGSAAEDADIRPGDVIVSADAEPVENPDELVEAVARKGVGDTIVLALVRDGVRQTVRATLGGRRLGMDSLLDRFRGSDPEATPPGEFR
jgi:membrane-associated protease RseP (regulator of RpoE activity)